MREDLMANLQQRYQQEVFFKKSMQTIEDIQSQLDPSMKDWIPGGSGYNSISPEVGQVNLASLRRNSRTAYYQNPHGRNIIRTLVKFTAGSGITVDFSEPDEKVAGEISDFWKKTTKKIKWIKFVREYARRLFRDGEAIVRGFDIDAENFHVRYIEPDSIADDDIIYDKNDESTPVAYKIGGKEIPAEKIHFAKADVDDNVPRGRPILEPILPYLTKYNRWLDARMVLNIVRASVTIVQEVQGTSTDLLRIANKNASAKQTSEQQRSRMVKPGTIIRGTPGVKYNMLSPNLDARDAAQDGRTLLLAIAASAGFPDVYVTADYANANFASTVTAQNPAIKEFEDWQMVIAEGLSQIVSWFLDHALENGHIPATVSDENGTRPTNLDFTLTFPPLLKRDVAQENNAYQIMNQNRVMSKRTWGLKMGLNPDDEEKLLAQEEQNAPPEKKNDQPPTDSPPKGPEDRSPRQGNVGSRIQSQTQMLSFVVTEDKKGSGGRRYSISRDENAPLGGEKHRKITVTVEPPQGGMLQ